MGLAGKFKGSLRSRKADISKGVDAAAKLARDKAPSKYQPKVESATSPAFFESYGFTTDS
jgi:hypothetical protein